MGRDVSSLPSSNAASIGSTGLAETGGGMGKPAGVAGIVTGGLESVSGSVSCSC